MKPPRLELSETAVLLALIAALATVGSGLLFTIAIDSRDLWFVALGGFCCGYAALVLWSETKGK